MPVRASVLNRVQIGVETVPGTVVAAGVQLLDSSITMQPRIPTSEYRPVGSKYPTDITVQKGFSEFTLEGVISYIDLTYWLSSALAVAAVAGTWNFVSDSFNPDTVQTYTMEYGSSAGAERYAYGLVNALELAFTRTEARMRGGGVGRIMADGITMTPTPTIAKSAPVMAKDVNVFVGDTIGGLANTGTFYEAGFNIRNRFGGVFSLDSTQPSFGSHVELVPQCTGRLVCAKDSIANGYMNDLLAAKTKFMRIKSTGAIFTGSTHYDLQITFPFKFREPNPGDHEGVYANTYEVIPVFDATYGKAMEVVLINGLTSL